MPEVTKPEIERSPLAHVIMQLLAARVKNIRKFEFLDRPPEDAIKTALNELKILGVSRDIGQNELELTDLGLKIGSDKAMIHLSLTCHVFLAKLFPKVMRQILCHKYIFSLSKVSLPHARPYKLGCVVTMVIMTIGHTYPRLLPQWPSCHIFEAAPCKSIEVFPPLVISDS